MQSFFCTTLTLLLMLFFTKNSISQTIISAKIVDQSNNAVSYVNVGIAEEGVGTVSDRNGNFELKIPETLSSRYIILSHVGFERLYLNAESIPNIIQMKRSYNLMDSIAVSAKRYKDKELGNRSKSGLLVSGFSSGDLGGEIGRKFNIRQPSLIDKIGFHIKHNVFENVLLRLNFYTIQNNMPDSLISGASIFRVSDKQTGQVEFSLEKPVMVITDIIVTLEMVEHSPAKSGYIYFAQTPPFWGKMYYRETSFDKVKKHRGGPMSMYMNIKY